jgi:hypothetical protein
MAKERPVDNEHDHVRRITALQARLSELRDEMEQVSLDFFEATEQFLEDWYEERARTDVASQPEKAREMGKAGLKKVKKKVRSLQRQVSRLVDEQLDHDMFWTHRNTVEELCNGLSSRRYAAYGEEGAAELKEPVIRLASRLGPVLAESGLLAFGTSWVRRGTAIRLGASPRWSAGMHRAMDRYRELNAELLQRARELVEAKRRQAEAEILNLWDQV